MAETLKKYSPRLVSIAYVTVISIITYGIYCYSSGWAFPFLFASSLLIVLWNEEKERRKKKVPLLDSLKIYFKKVLLSLSIWIAYGTVILLIGYGVHCYFPDWEDPFLYNAFLFTGVAGILYIERRNFHFLKNIWNQAWEVIFSGKK